MGERDALFEQLDVTSGADLRLLDQELENRYAKAFETGEELLPVEERGLIVVDRLLKMRCPDGSYSDATLQRAHTDLLTSTNEMAIPHAISTIYMDKVGENTYMTDSESSVDIAESGFKYHHDAAARTRVFVEIEEAKHNAATLKPGFLRPFISPRMSETDAPIEVAQREHLGDDDALRVTGLLTDAEGNVTQMYMEAILIRDVPLEAWVAMLRDPNNIFGKSIHVEDERSALSVMKIFAELELPIDKMPEGVKGLVAAVIPYVKNEEERRSVESQYEMLHADQQEIHKKASMIADRWLAFELELAESMFNEKATPYIQDFIAEFDDVWGDETRKMLSKQRLADGSVYMTRELAVKIEQVRTKTLWIKAAVANNNQAVIEQMDKQVVAQIAREEARIVTMHEQGYSMHQILAADAANNQTVAMQDVKGGGGCTGEIKADIKTNNTDPSADGASNIAMQSSESESKKDCMYRHSGCYCCPYDDFGRPLKERVEVTARRSSNGVARCLRSGCGAALDADGKVLNKGGIYERAMRHLTQEKEPEIGEAVDAAFKEAGVESFEDEKDSTEEEKALPAGKLALAGAGV
jgi:hypothetical protein